MRIRKIWQVNRRQFVFQVMGTPSTGTDSFDKFFFVVDLHPHSFGIQAIKEKPADTQSSGNGIEHLRRILMGKSIAHVYLADAGRRILLEGYPEEERPRPWNLYIRKSDGGQLEYIDQDAVSLLRIGSKGIFTKKVLLDPETDRIIREQQWTEWNPGLVNEIDRDQVSIEPPNSGGGSPEVNSEIAALRRKLKRKLKTLNKSILGQQAKVLAPAELEKLRYETTMLQKFSHLYRDGMFHLTIPTIVSGEAVDVTIELDPELNLGQNLQKNFSLVKRKQKAAEQTGRQIRQIQSQVKDIERILNALSGDLDKPRQNLQAIYTRFGLKPPDESKSKGKRAEEARRKPYWIFEVLPEVFIMVGKSARDNDELTKTAKSNDLWFHAIGTTGSHIILPARYFNKASEKDQEFLKQAAGILAIHYSTLQKDMAGEVYVTHKRQLRKNKGLPPGKWLVGHADTVFFKFDSIQRDSILAKKSRVGS